MHLKIGEIKKCEISKACSWEWGGIHIDFVSEVIEFSKKGVSRHEGFQVVRVLYRDNLKKILLTVFKVNLCKTITEKKV